MTPFELLSPAARAVFALWALFLCLADIGSALLATVKKRVRPAVFAALLFLPVYFLWQVIFDLSLSGGPVDAAEASAFFGGMPWLWWLAAFAAQTAASAFLFARNVRYDRNFVTPGAVKRYLDKIPCGVCCWRENGRVLFSNVCMNELCLALTGAPLLNGDHFRGAVEGGILNAGGKVWRFSCRDFSLDGENLHEMIASDITVEYAKTETLEKEKAYLAELNRELGDHYLSIDETVRRQEILQAKVKIHDEMNRLMLSTTAAGRDDVEELDRIFSLWEQNALLLCMEADEEAKAADDLEKLAAALKIRLVRKGEEPAFPEKERRLFHSAAREAMINAVKHAGAKELAVSFEETDGAVLCRFTNDGRAPSAPVTFTGGLANLALLAKKEGASLSAETDGAFTLTLVFPKKTKNQPNG